MKAAHLTNPSSSSSGRPFSYADALKKSSSSAQTFCPTTTTCPSAGRGCGIPSAGLVNLGNTCFLNSILQCITHTTPLVQNLRSPHHHSCNPSFCLLCELRQHVDIAMSSSSAVVPASLANNLNKLAPSLRLGRQEDAHEFFSILIDKLHRCCLLDDSHGSLVSRVFGGRLRSRLECHGCGHVSDTFEPMVDISLEIEDATCLHGALRSFTGDEIIDGLLCGGCKAPAAVVKKQLKVDRSPAVIAIHLKRFSCDGYSIKKIHKFIQYPMELDLDAYLSSRGESSVYELYAMVVHQGTVNGGHYYSFVRSSSLEWYRMDDSSVTRASQNSVLSQSAYILFYIKKTPPS